ncbi:polyadenylation and cleavage factor4 [Dorcoceras hygrometricum]|uniref:Polyadenylation and cleavage factor4 n=1 Tax=Dorcoceras hygrometricum TaxID=472368 RepID=A0A2Z7AWQ7_9LAMI|nr:polyadenylation and cleavage factor4 [Dorcoceras hygrometricum]
MSLFDLQDVCIAIGSIATLDLPMVVDLIGICGFKGPYCTLTTTNWFLQALSVIPRGSWGDVARRFTMIRWAVLLVQADEGVSFLVVDRIGDIYHNLPRRADVIVTTVGARHKCQQESKNRNFWRLKPPAAACDGAYMHARARAKPRDGAAHGRRLMAATPRAIVARRRPRFARGLREACAKLRAAGCGGVARWSRFRPMLHAQRWPLFHARPRTRHRATFRKEAPLSSATGRGLLADRFRCLDAPLGRRCASLARRCACAAVIFLRGGAAVGRPALRRVSGDVVTAGLISSRVWFGPVPGSP